MTLYGVVLFVAAVTAGLITYFIPDNPSSTYMMDNGHVRGVLFLVILSWVVGFVIGTVLA